MIWFTLTLLVQLGLVLSSEPTRNTPTSFTFLILNERHSLHQEKAEELSADINRQADGDGTIKIATFVASEYFPQESSYYTLFPLLERFCDSSSQWFIFINEFVNIHLANLTKLLSTKNPLERHYYGKVLMDAHHTIIHHYAHPEAVLYPDIRAGFILSQGALIEACAAYESQDKLATQFHIDTSYEFSSWLAERTGTVLTSLPALCAGSSPDSSQCAVTAGTHRICQSAGDVSLHVSIKTHSGNHYTRLPVVKKTWLKDAPSHAIYSDVEDASLGTLSTDVPNSSRGHCAKTLEILRRSVHLQQDWQWLVVADDDTMLSIPRLSKLLACYPTSTPTAMGEVYGYSSGGRVLDYQTGGSGMIFNRQMVQKIIFDKSCVCSPDDPDDMFIGACIARLGINIINIRDLHQNPPSSYSSKLLQSSSPISFHRFGSTDAFEIYRDYLQDNDQKIEL